MTERLTDDAAGIARAAALLGAGRLVAFATETVYGLGADATSGEAVASIYTAKGRPQFNPLICHFADAATAFTHVEPSAAAERAAARFWPGPLTLVLPRRPTSPVSSLAAAGLPSLAIRVPSHPTARALLAAAGVPIAAPSANRSGRLSPTRASHVADDLEGRIAAILDSGPTSVGLESTILDLTTATPTLLRPGAIGIDRLEAWLGPVATAGNGAIIAPGMLASHYAPRLKLRPDASAPTSTEAWLAFGPHAVTGRHSLNLSESADLTEAAANLFDALHRLDASATAAGLLGIAVAPIPRHGVGLAINDRLRRAAAP